MEVSEFRNQQEIKKIMRIKIELDIERERERERERDCTRIQSLVK